MTLADIGPGTGVLCSWPGLALLLLTAAAGAALAEWRQRGRHGEP